jgi:hypothetical protein
MSSGLRTRLTLLPLLQALLLLLGPLLRPRLPIGAELLQSLLLFSAEQSVNIGLQPRFRHREIGLHVGDVLHRGADLRFVEGNRFDRLPSRILYRAHPVHEGAHLFPILLRELPHLLLLRIGQIEGPERKAGSGTARTDSRSTSARTARRRTLRVHEAATGDHRNHECDLAEKMKTTNHGSALH